MWSQSVEVPYVPWNSTGSKVPSTDQASIQPAGPPREGRRLRWEPPTLLASDTASAPFPVHCLPRVIGDQVQAVATFTQTPLDLAGAVVLAVLAAAVGGRVTVKVKNGWREPTNLFLAIALPPGSRKSPVFSELTAPMLEAERITHTFFVPALMAVMNEVPGAG